MPSPPFASLQVSVNGGGPTSGGVDVPSAATLQFSGVSTVGWRQQRFEIYEYPEGFVTPVGWTLAADGTIYSTDVVPTLVTLPANTVHWGPWAARLKVNEALDDDATTVPNLTDSSTILHMASPLGQRMISAFEDTQFCTATTLHKKWTRTIQRNQIILEGRLAPVVAASPNFVGDGVTPIPTTGFVRLPSGAIAVTFKSNDGTQTLYGMSMSSDLLWIGTDHLFTAAKQVIGAIIGAAPGGFVNLWVGDGIKATLGINSVRIAGSLPYVGENGTVYGRDGAVTIDMANADYATIGVEHSNYTIKNGSDTPQTAIRTLSLPDADADNGFGIADSSGYSKFVRNMNGAGFAIVVGTVTPGTTVTIADGKGAVVGIDAGGAYRMSPDV